MPIGIRESAFGRKTWLFPVVIRATCGNHGKTFGLAAFRVKTLGAPFTGYRPQHLRSTGLGLRVLDWGGFQKSGSPFYTRKACKPYYYKDPRKDD